MRHQKQNGTLGHTHPVLHMCMRMPLIVRVAKRDGEEAGGPSPSALWGHNDYGRVVGSNPRLSQPGLARLQPACACSGCHGLPRSTVGAGVGPSRVPRYVIEHAVAEHIRPGTPGRLSNCHRGICGVGRVRRMRHGQPRRPAASQSASSSLAPPPAGARGGGADGARRCYWESPELPVTTGILLELLRQRKIDEPGERVGDLLPAREESGVTSDASRPVCAAALALKRSTAACASAAFCALSATFCASLASLSARSAAFASASASAFASFARAFASLLSRSAAAFAPLFSFSALNYLFLLINLLL